MAHGKLTFVMPSNSAEAFEAFFNHSVRVRWDTLLNISYVESGGTHPSAGVVTANIGRGWKRFLSMRTRFVAYEPSRLAAAILVAPTGPFARWGASMRFSDRPDGYTDLVYTFTLHTRPHWSAWLLDPVARLLFIWETRRRFRAMAEYLASAPPTTLGRAANHPDAIR